MRALASLFLLVFAECKETEFNPVKGLRKIASGISVGTHTEVEVWTRSSPAVGYTPITFVFKDAMHLHRVEVSHLIVRPRLSAGHAVPMEAPAKTEHGYEGSITFLQPSSDTLSYEMEFEFHRDGEMGVITFPHNVATTHKPRLVWFKHHNENYCAAIHLPDPIKTGLNSVELIIYKKEGNSYSLAKDFSLTINSRTSTGLKPPRNFEVTLKPASGRYGTVVNFIAKGNWHLNFKIFANGSLAASAPFEVSF